MTEMSEIMQELACAVRQKNFDGAEEALTIMAARFGHGGAIAKGRRQAIPHERVELDVPNVVTIHDLPRRDGVKIVLDHGVPQWRPAA